jgi:transposase InsO family protein
MEVLAGKHKDCLPSHLQDLFERATKDFCPEEKAAVVKLLSEFSDIFSKDDLDLGLTKLVEHTIDVGTSKPVKQQPRRVPLAFEGEDRKALEMWQKQGSIRPSSSPWASPMVFVRKKNGKTRPCIDYRLLNKVTQKDAYPLPRTQDCIDALSGSVMFSTMDITSAYNQISIREEDIPKTAFVSKYGLFEYTTMPFGLCNAPATFQRMMEIALAGLQWDICLIYLDDVIVFAPIFEQMLTRLRDVFSRIRTAGLKLKPAKCHLFQREVTFLGHVINSDGVLPDPENVKKIIEWDVPKDVTGVRSFLGMGNYYRRFIKDYSSKMQPLIELTKKGKPFEWSEECQKAFDFLKTSLVGPEILAFPTDSGEYILDTDACAISIGAVLSQVQDGRERVIAYGSKSLCKAEKNYCVTDRELLAVKFFMERYKHYLLGRKFLVRSDHQALKWLFTLKEPKGRIARWIQAMSPFDFTVEYRRGKQHGNADAMSRCPNVRDCQCPADKMEELICGPCHKCVKRTQDMESSYVHEAKCARRITIIQSDFLNHLSLLRMLSKVVWQWICPTVLWILVLTGISELATTLNDDVLGESHSDILLKNVANLHVDKDGRTRPKLTKNCNFSLWQKLWSFFSGMGKFSFNRGYPTEKILRRTRQDSSWALPYSMAKLRVKQLDDSDIGPVLRWKESGARPHGPVVCKSSPATRHYWNLWDSLELRDGVLFRTFYRKDATGAHLQFIVPESIRHEILHQMHGVLLSGHLGKKKTREKTLQRFYWYGMREDVNNWVSRCDVCGAVKPLPKKARAPLGEMHVGAPMDRLATDVLGPFPETERGNKYILVVTDHFTKWMEIFAIPDQTAVTCAEIILNEVIARYGCPYDIHSDQGRNYESEIFAELCRLLEIRKTRTSPGNPKCNGQAERFNRTLLRMIKAYLKGQQREWDKNLGCFAAAYRASVNESTGLTPNLLMLGREVRLPVEVMFGSETTHLGEEITSYGMYVDKLRKHMQHAHSIARQHLSAAGVRQKEVYDTKLLLNTYKPGDMVWYQTDISQLHIAPKLRKPYEGPYVVVKRVNDLNYVIQLDAKGKRRFVHHNKLKPYKGDLRFKWAKSAINRAKSEATLKIDEPQVIRCINKKKMLCLCAFR